MLNKTRKILAKKILAVSSAVYQLEAKIVKNEYDKKIFNASAKATTALLLGISPFARADSSNGFASMGQQAADQGKSLQESAAILFYVIGFCGVGYGCYNVYRKGKEGEQSQVTGTKMLVPMLGGAMLAAVGFMLDKTAESVNIDTDGYGTV